MKNKKIKLVLLGVILAVGFLGSYNLTQAAGCCVDGTPASGPVCFSPDKNNKCLTGALNPNKTCEELKAMKTCIDIKTDATTDNTNTTDTTTSTTDSTTSAPITFPNPIAINSVSGLLDSILNNLMGLIVIIAVIFIIIGGIMYMTSAGNEAMVTRAKKTWTGATVGLAIALASPTFLKQIKEILNSNSSTGGTADQWVDKALTIKEIAINVLNFLLSIFGILAIIALVIGGGMYLTAYGDEKKIDSGKKIITYAIIGIVVALSALVLTRQIASLIGVMAK